MDDLLDMIRTEKQDFSKKPEGVVFQRVFKRSYFAKMLRAIESIHRKVTKDIQDEYGYGYKIYPFSFNMSIGDIRKDESYIFIMDVVHDSKSFDERLKTEILNKYLVDFRKLGLPCEIVEKNNIISYKSKVIFRVE